MQLNVQIYKTSHAHEKKRKTKKNFDSKQCKAFFVTCFNVQNIIYLYTHDPMYVTLLFREKDTAARYCAKDRDK